MDEERIIEETLKGNNQAFGELIMKYEPSVYRLALFRVRNGTDAEEIAQEVFLTSFRKLGQLRDRRHFGAWLRAITLRHCAMWFRCAKKKDNDHQFDDDFSYTEIADVQAGDQDPFNIRGLIRELPSGMQSAAQLCLEEELDPTAAAGMLGLKPGTLRKRFFDARAKLQRAIVQKAEENGQLDLLPKEFAKLCVCRCEKAQAAQKGGDERMNQLKNCGCGCMEKARQEETSKVQVSAEPKKNEKAQQGKK